MFRGRDLARDFVGFPEFLRYTLSMRHRQLWRRLTPWGLLAVSCAASAQTDPPAGYYDTATGFGSVLKQQLHDIIDGHTVRSYGDARSLLQITDEDPADPDRMILVYDNVSLDVSAINPGGSIPGWDSAATWNREHTWPRAWGIDSSGPDNSDLHQLRPSFTTTNSNRANLAFGGAYGQSFGVKSDQGATVWYPGDAHAGQIARQQFYLAVRYDGSDAQTNDLELIDSGNLSGNNMGDLSRLLEWHYQAPVDNFELGRNQKVFGYQDNRNPFIDRPEYVWSVFVDQNNDTQLYVGDTPFLDGASFATANLGAVYVDAPVPADHQVILRKTGTDGTYYAVTPQGDATSSVTGRHNAFAMAGMGPDSVTLDVGLDTSTATAGLKTGTVVIDNLDVTTGAGTGLGGNDADDSIVVLLSVLDHAQPSFSPDSEVFATTIDLGIVALGTPDVTVEIPIYNRVATEGFTADLSAQLGFGHTGDTDTLELVLPGITVPAGQSDSGTVRVDTSQTGDFAADWNIQVVEQVLPGRESFPLMELNLSATVALPGDADLSGQVEQGDLDAVLQNWGQTAGVDWQTGDLNQNGQVEQGDLDLVLQNWGSTASPDLRGVVVPEPAAGAVLVLLCLARREIRVALQRG